MGIFEQGINGERMAFDFMHIKKIKSFQPDLICLGKNGKYFIVEVKHQEMFKAPPIDGHGLPPYQVEARLHFYKETNIRVMFLVFDSNAGFVYYQWLDELEKGKKITTKNNKRVNYDINSFVKEEYFNMIK